MNIDKETEDFRARSTCKSRAANEEKTKKKYIIHTYVKCGKHINQKTKNKQHYSLFLFFDWLKQ